MYFPEQNFQKRSSPPHPLHMQNRTLDPSWCNGVSVYGKKGDTSGGVISSSPSLFPVDVSCHLTEVLTALQLRSYLSCSERGFQRQTWCYTFPTYFDKCSTSEKSYQDLREVGLFSSSSQGASPVFFISSVSQQTPDTNRQLQSSLLSRQTPHVNQQL